MVETTGFEVPAPGYVTVSLTTMYWKLLVPVPHAVVEDDELANVTARVIL